DHSRSSRKSPRGRSGTLEVGRTRGGPPGPRASRARLDGDRPPAGVRADRWVGKHGRRPGGFHHAGAGADGRPPGPRVRLDERPRHLHRHHGRRHRAVLQAGRRAERRHRGARGHLRGGRRRGRLQPVPRRVPPGDQRRRAHGEPRARRPHRKPGLRAGGRPRRLPRRDPRADPPPVAGRRGARAQDGIGERLPGAGGRGGRGAGEVRIGPLPARVPAPRQPRRPSRLARRGEAVLRAARRKARGRGGVRPRAALPRARGARLRSPLEPQPPL
ncbi:MAG: Exodeoxyribonuclease V gamma chain, partial [uncultured Gemmatimonadetes bacterium]